MRNPFSQFEIYMYLHWTGGVTAEVTGLVPCVKGQVLDEDVCSLTFSALETDCRRCPTRSGIARYQRGNPTARCYPGSSGQQSYETSGHWRFYHHILGGQRYLGVSVDSWRLTKQEGPGSCPCIFWVFISFFTPVVRVFIVYSLLLLGLYHLFDPRMCWIEFRSS